MNTLVNICGPERSGTTMLDLMLGSGQNTFSLGEISGWFRLYRYRDYHPLPDVWKDIPGPAPHEIDSLLYGPVSEFHRTAFDVFRVTHLVDSSKEKTWILETQKWASMHRLGVVNFLLIKNPLEYAHSFWKRGRYHDWARVYRRYYQWILSSGVEFTSVYLDDLVHNPSETLELICSHVGLPYFPGKEHFWHYPHYNVKGSLGVRQQVGQGQSSIEKQPLSADFLHLIPEVQDTVANGPIQGLLDTVDQYRLARFSKVNAEATAGHTYSPDIFTHIRNEIHCLLKKPWLRLQHNSTLANWFHRFKL